MDVLFTDTHAETKRKGACGPSQACTFSGSVLSGFNKLTQLTKKSKRKDRYSSHRADSVEKLPPKSARRTAKRASILSSPDCFPVKYFREQPGRAAGSLTIEASAALPVFVICMIAVLWLGNVMYEAARFSNILAETGEEMAIAMYASEFTEDESPLPAALSIAYAEGRIRTRAGSAPSVKTISLLLSSLPDEEDKIDLEMTYQIRSPVGMITMPWVFFLQKACVRGWVGRSGSGGREASTDEDDPSKRTVYVAENGRVCHLDPECTHINLSIRLIRKEDLRKARNTSGGKYHPCEHCGKNAGDMIYITTDGDCYHSSLECSGLKRTVKEMTLEEAGDLPLCSRCGGHERHENHDHHE